MSGKYSGLQARIRERNHLADYIPCFAHSLNLVGHSAVDNISVASKFFELVENAYCFFQCINSSVGAFSQCSWWPSHCQMSE